MRTRARVFTALAAGALAVLALVGPTVADENESLEERLIRASEGLQMPGSESDSVWRFVSYPGEEVVPTAERMARITGCSGYPEGVMTRLDFDATLDDLSRVEGWMDGGQRESARGFRRLTKLFHREYGDDLAVYRCETGEHGQVHVSFVGANADGLSGLMTINIET